MKPTFAARLRPSGRAGEGGHSEARPAAGLPGAVLAPPQGVAFATLAGRPAQYGFCTAIVPCVVATLLGSSRRLVSG